MTRSAAREAAVRRRRDTQGQCGYGPRQPLLVISPYAKQNYVDHQVTDQASILRFIEDNWNLGRVGGNSADFKGRHAKWMFDFRGRTAPRLITRSFNGSATCIKKRLESFNLRRSPPHTTPPGSSRKYQWDEPDSFLCDFSPETGRLRYADAREREHRGAKIAV